MIVQSLTHAQTSTCRELSLICLPRTDDINTRYFQPNFNGVKSMSDRKVVKGGGENLYKISESSGWFYVYKVNVGFGSNDNVGKARSLGDALELIKSHSGRDIESIS